MIYERPENEEIQEGKQGETSSCDEGFSSCENQDFVDDNIDDAVEPDIDYNDINGPLPSDVLLEDTQPEVEVEEDPASESNIEETPKKQKGLSTLTRFNIWNLVCAIIGLVFFIDALLGINFYYLHTVHGVSEKVPFALIDVLYAFIHNCGELSYVFATKGSEAGINLIVKDAIALIDIIFIAISILMQSFLVIKNLVHLITRSGPSVSTGRNMGNQGQLRGGWTVLIFSYACVFVPYFLGLAYRNTKGNGSFFNSIAEAFINNTYFYGLTPWHYLFLGLFILLLAAHIFRFREQQKLRKENRS